MIKSKDQYDILGQGEEKILKIGLENIDLIYTTVFTKEQALTLQIRDFVYLSETQLIEEKISSELMS